MNPRKDEGKQRLRKGYTKLKGDRLSAAHVWGLKGRVERGSEKSDRRMCVQVGA